MVKRLQNQKHQKLNNSRTRNTLCQSKFTRSRHYKAVSTLRAFAFLEYKNHLPELAELCTPEQFFNEANEFHFKTKIPTSTSWWSTVRFSPHKGYTYVTKFHNIGHLISKLAISVLRKEDFNDDWTLTQDGSDFKERLRKRWEHQIKIGGKGFYFSSARQLLNVILDDIENYLGLRCDDFVTQLNKEIDDLFDSIKFDGIPTSGASLRKALGLQQIPKHYSLAIKLRQELYQKGHEQNASNLIKKFSEEPIENLVSDNYLDRIVGLIQAQSDPDPKL